jgi:hypothetical protein
MFAMHFRQNAIRCHIPSDISTASFKVEIFDVGATEGGVNEKFRPMTFNIGLKFGHLKNPTSLL